MGNFDEDGSFIGVVPFSCGICDVVNTVAGNYTEYQEEAAAAVQSKLLTFSQLYHPS